VLDNGSGLSRIERISANSLAALLSHANASRVAAAYADSLVQLGTDPAMRDRARAAAGRAQLKTGTLRDVTAVAGFVQGMSGRRYIVAGMINHTNASAGRAALDQLLEWTVLESP
jgi:D-alanyl-D-alanine carboxypeptidase/D-alanyl-D-alanine-endopeptidase (penicillin-binding protein 4)